MISQQYFPTFILRTLYYSSQMKKFLLALTFLAPFCVFSQVGDTVVVQTFTYGSPQNDWFVFPPDTGSYEKVLMYYKLKCNPDQSPACGEWDYLTYTFLYDHTGELDSTLYTAPSFTVGSQSPDTFMYMNSPSYSYWQNYQYIVVYDDTTALDSATIGFGAAATTETFNTAHNDGKAQYLWKGSELTSAGLSAGNITGLAFDFLTVGSELNDLTIRMKPTSLDSLSAGAYETDTFQTVYQSTVYTPALGRNKFNFLEAFNWDGSSNIVVEVCFNNATNGTASEIEADSVGLGFGIIAAENNSFLDFEGADHVNVPSNAFTGLDSAITVMFWQYGDPDIQPQSDYIFEGLDANGNRVVNSHLPWGNSRVYWDAGNSGTSNYDRIDKEATDADFEGRWNHWAFTKNLADSSLKIFLNGQLWHSGTGFTRDMSGITQFKIGSRGNGNGTHYDGYVDEFSVWDVALDEVVIAQWMNNDLDNSHPNYNDLLLYYQFNDGTGAWAMDGSPNGHNGYLNGMPAWKGDNGCDLIRNISETAFRPEVTFKQGTFTSHIDTVAFVDSLENPQIQVIVYNDSLNPLTATDTILAWPVYYNSYVFDANGNAIDSAIVAEDTTVYLQEWPYYGEPFEVIDRYELGRFITPYGIGLNLGQGFTWVYDVSDYVKLLHDSVHLSAGNWQELLDMKFLFIKGTPPRDVISLENVWNGNYGLNNFEQSVPPKKLLMDANGEMFRLNVRTSGHGFDNPTNCAEFCPKIHSVDVDGSTIHTWQIVQECSTNPLYPQGGTWIYDRAGWCPGAKVPTREVELTDHVTPGDSALIDYNSQSDQYGNYVVETQLVTYGEANFTNNAAVEDIISPSIKDEHYRYNPICKEPMIVIKNVGSASLTSLTIEYGIAGGNSSSYQWTGDLGFLETETVMLPTPDWTGIADGAGVFEVNISMPNGVTDEYTANDYYRSEFEIPNILPNNFVIWTRTNTAGYENSWTLKDDLGNVLYSRSNMDNSTTYKDTVELPGIGCFHFELEDADDDGMSWWANNDGSGYIRFRGADTPAILETFDSKWTISGNQSQYRGDFGRGLSYHFTTNWGLSTEDIESVSEINVFPNPTNGLVTLDFALETRQDVEVEIVSLTGQKVFSESFVGVDFLTHSVDMSALNDGIYLVNILTEKRRIVKKLVLRR